MANPPTLKPSGTAAPAAGPVPLSLAEQQARAIAAVREVLKRRATLPLPGASVAPLLAEIDPAARRR